MSGEISLEEILENLLPTENVGLGKWFGKACLKVNGKVFVVKWGNSLVFKLSGEGHSSALEVDKAHLFDPRGKGAAMKEWVEIPLSSEADWMHFANLAKQYVSSI